MRLAVLTCAATAALALAACSNNSPEETAPAATSEAVEASGIADEAAVTAAEDQAAADARAAADAAGPMAAPATEPAPTTPVEGQ